MAGGAAMMGRLHLVGVGPGDPELVTLKAVNLLDEVPVIAYVRPRDGEAMALAICRRYCNPHAEYVEIEIPMAVERGPAEEAYARGAAIIRTHLAAGRDVAYLCEGDPLFYGSAMYLYSRLGEDVPISVIPGVTSVSAAAAAIPLPLAGRNDVVKILPATLPDDALLPELDGSTTIAIIKVGRHFERIRALLQQAGRGQSAFVVDYATLPNQKIAQLADYGDGERPYFSIILSYAGGEFSR